MIELVVLADFWILAFGASCVFFAGLWPLGTLADFSVLASGASDRFWDFGLWGLSFLLICASGAFGGCLDSGLWGLWRMQIFPFPS